MPKRAATKHYAHIQKNIAHKIPAVDGAKAYADLKADVVKVGILDREYGYYSFLITFGFAGYLLSIYNVIAQSNLWAVAAWSFGICFFVVQLAGLVHDSGHRAIFKSSRANNVLGTITSICIAMRFESWRLKHNEHHAHPNTDDEDPDFAIPFLSFTKEEYERKTGLGRKLRKYQIYLYFPIGMMVVFSTRLRSIKEFIMEFSPRILPELIGFSIVFICWFFMPFLLFPLSKALVIFTITNFVTGVYLFNIFAPNHKGMPKLAKGTKLSFLQQQVMTSRNITSNWFTDFIYLGLNNQIEHHLFPSTPRNKLRRITPYVLRVCEKMRLEYTQVGIIETNKIILGELKQFTK